MEKQVRNSCVEVTDRISFSLKEEKRKLNKSRRRGTKQVRQKRQRNGGRTVIFDAAAHVFFTPCDRPLRGRCPTAWRRAGRRRRTPGATRPEVEEKDVSREEGGWEIGETGERHL